MNSQYNVFLMVELAKEKGIIDTELEYDLMWETGCGLINEFEKSKFNSDKQGLYDCISEFLRYKTEIIAKPRLLNDAKECAKHLVWQLENEPYEPTDVSDRLNRLDELNTKIRNL